MATSLEHSKRRGRCQEAPPRFLDAAELGDVLGLTRDSIYDHVRHGLPALRIGTGPKARLRFDLAAVARWMAESAGLRALEPKAAPREPGLQRTFIR